mgnify:CR=1 FL=1
MAIELKMPALSPTMEEGTLAKWLVKEGDTVKSGDILAEIETDKATMEYEAIDEGTIASILIAEGTDNVKVGTVIATITGEGEEAAAPAAAAAPAPAPVEEAKAAAALAQHEAAQARGLFAVLFAFDIDAQLGRNDIAVLGAAAFDVFSGGALRAELLESALDIFIGHDGGGLLGA